MQSEVPCSLVSCRFHGDENDYYCVGTAVARLSEDEPKEGRIHVLQVQDRRLSTVTVINVEVILRFLLARKLLLFYLVGLCS